MLLEQAGDMTRTDAQAIGEGFKAIAIQGSLFNEPHRALDRGAAARRKQLERQRLRRRPGAEGAGTGAAEGDAARGTMDDEKPSSLFDVLEDGLFDA